MLGGEEQARTFEGNTRTPKPKMSLDSTLHRISHETSGKMYTRLSSLTPHPPTRNPFPPATPPPYQAHEALRADIWTSACGWRCRRAGWLAGERATVLSDDRTSRVQGPAHDALPSHVSLSPSLPSCLSASHGRSHPSRPNPPHPRPITVIGIIRSIEK